MIETLLDVKSTDTVDDLCLRLGTFLGLKEAVPLPAFKRAVEDQAYAHDLIVCRNAPGFLAALLNDPENLGYTADVSGGRIADAGDGHFTDSSNGRIADAGDGRPAHSNTELVSKAVKAFVSWGKTGFSRADPEVIEARENTCLACPNLASPDKTLQKLIAVKQQDGVVGKRTGDKTCVVCGCNVSRKIKIPGESCPQEDPGHPGFTRWGDPVVQASA